jgi:hypothetical protein
MIPPPTQPVSYTAAAHLAGAECVNVQIGSQLKPLAAPYANLYKMLAKGAQAFTNQVGHKQEFIAVDRGEGPHRLQPGLSSKSRFSRPSGHT